MERVETSVFSGIIWKIKKKRSENDWEANTLSSTETKLKVKNLSALLVTSCFLLSLSSTNSFSFSSNPNLSRSALASLVSCQTLRASPLSLCCQSAVISAPRRFCNHLHHWYLAIANYTLWSEVSLPWCHPNLELHSSSLSLVSKAPGEKSPSYWST